MSLMKRNPFAEFEDFTRRMERALANNNWFTAADEQLATGEWMPNVDIAETPEAFQIKAEIPDMKKEDIKLNVDDGTLSLSGERRQEKEEKGKRYHRIERSYGRFERRFTLPANVDAAKAHASYANGVLEVMLPKTTEAKTNQTIKIS